MEPASSCEKDGYSGSPWRSVKGGLSPAVAEAAEPLLGAPPWQLSGKGTTFWASTLHRCVDRDDVPTNSVVESAVGDLGRRSTPWVVLGRGKVLLTPFEGKSNACR
ncbi:hypothetical protein GW17_00051810 [Ensete ventricosum]|nr:hypothetical protein GW17_00051810 [Ensete ventricosum]